MNKTGTNRDICRDILRDKRDIFNFAHVPIGGHFGGYIVYDYTPNVPLSDGGTFSVSDVDRFSEGFEIVHNWQVAR